MARRKGQLMSDTTVTSTAEVPSGRIDEEVARDLLKRPRREGVSLVGSAGCWLA